MILRDDSVYVLIHGVGDPQPGALLHTVMRTTGSGEPLIPGTFPAGGHHYPCGFDLKGNLRVVEVNWADLPPRARSWTSTAGYYFGFVSRLIALGERWWSTPNPSMGVPGGNRKFGLTGALLRSLIWSIVMTIQVMLVCTAPGGGMVSAKAVTAIVLLLFDAIAFGFSIRALARPQPQSWLAVALAGVIQAASAVFVILAWMGTVPNEAVTRISTQVYGVHLTLVMLGLAWCLGVIMWVRPPDFGRFKGWRQSVARLAGFWVPMGLIGALGAVLLAGALGLAKALGWDMTEWQSDYTKGLPFDLATSEITFAAATTFALGVVPVGVLVDYLRSRDGKRIHNGVGTILAAGACLLPVVLAEAILSKVLSFHPITIAPGELWSFYVGSAMRVIALVPYVRGPLNVMLDVSGDVLYHVVQHPAPDNWRERRQSRLRDCLIALAASSPREGQTDPPRIVVVAHSQGSALARDVVPDVPEVAVLVTCGSPLSSLYRPYFGWLPGQGGSEGAINWHGKWYNFFRESDYIGCDVVEQDANSRQYVHNEKLSEPGDHTNYWPGTDFWTQVSKV